MNTKAFILLSLGVMAFGGGLGGSFVLGLVIGKDTGVEETVVVAPSPRPPSGSTHRSFVPEAGGPDLANLRQRTRPGALTQEELTTLREQVRSQFGSGASGSGQFGFEGRSHPLTGTVTVAGDHLLILNTPQGDVEISVTKDVIIRQTVEIAMEQITDGTRITVIGQPDARGSITANMIQVIPEGEEFTAGGGFGDFSGARPGETGVWTE